MFRIQSITRDKYLTDDELCRLYAWCWAHRNNPLWADRIDLVRMVLGSGARVSELPGLRKPEDCHEDGIIHIRKSKTGFQRMVRIMPEYLPFYREKRRSLPDGLWWPRSVVNGRTYVAPYTTRSCQQFWAAVLAAANVRPLSIHAGRHTYATWELASRRLLIHEVQSQLGHSTPTMTLAFYSHSVVECLYQDGPPRWREVALHGETKQRLLRAV